jgi:hypothetical protein
MMGTTLKANGYFKVLAAVLVACVVAALLVALVPEKSARLVRFLA